MVIAEAKGIGKWYEDKCVLLQCSMEIRAGESYGLVGINGAGKTTLMKILLGLQRAGEGSVLLFGEKPQTDRRYLTRIGSMIERPVFYEHHLLVLYEPFNGNDTFVFGGLADERRGRYDFSYLGRTGGTSECAKLCVLHYLCDNGNRKCDHQGLWKRESIPSFSYPVPRKKIYQVKCLLVGALTLPVAITGIGVPLGVLYAVSWVTGIQLQMISDRFWMEVPVAGMSVVFVAGAMFTCNRTTNKIEKMEV